jgi:leucine-zipper of insertion element IS481
MPHRNAPLSETERLRLARVVAGEGWPVRRAAERFQVSPTTAARWAARYRQHGAAWMADRSSRPHTSPNRTPRRAERRIVGLRVARRLGPARIGARLGLPASTVHAVLARYRCPPLAHLDRGSGRPVRRYEWARPGELVHVDVAGPGRNRGQGLGGMRRLGCLNDELLLLGGGPTWLRPGTLSAFAGPLSARICVGASEPARRSGHSGAVSNNRT